MNHNDDQFKVLEIPKTIDDLLNEKIERVYKWRDRYIVFLEQTDEGDDGFYWVCIKERTVQYDSYIRLFGEDDFNEKELAGVPVNDFIKLCKW